MVVAATPTDKRNSHLISLTDGITTVGLTLCDAKGEPTFTLAKAGFPRSAMRISQGQTGYGDLEPPFTPAVQSDWSGGRGAEDFDSDTTRYYDSEGVDTIRGDILLGPEATYGSGMFSLYPIVARNGDYAMTKPEFYIKYAASSYTPVGNLAVRAIRFPLKAAAGTGAVYLQAQVYSDSSGPSTVLGSSALKHITLTTAYLDYDFEIPITLTGGTKYWIGIVLATTATITVGKNTTATGNAIYGKTSGAWANEASNQALAISLKTGSSGGKVHFFRYRGALYGATAPDDMSLPKIYLNGYRGVASSNSADKTKLNTALNLTGVDLSGKVVKIVAGKGFAEAQNWRVISSNTVTGTNDVITVNPGWNVTHDTTTEYVILGCDTWQDVAGMTGGAAYASLLKYPVTSVCVSNNLVHFAQGISETDSYIVDMCQDDNAGTMRTRFRAQPRRGVLVKRHVLQTGAKRVWWSGAAGVMNDVSYGSAVSYGTDLTASGTITCGSDDTTITGLIVYGTPPVLYVFKEDCFGSINNDIYAEVPLSEMDSVASEQNGRTLLRHDVYLYFSLLEGWERFYNNHLDDLGPNRDEGLPAGRNGPISCAVGYAGRFYVGVDAGNEGYSSVQCYNGLGWHEVYRAPFGKRIRDLFIQVIPGDTVDRLWASEDEDLVWLPIAINPRKAVGYRYRASGSLVSAWMYGNLKDVRKYYDAVRLFTENLSTSHIQVTLAYQTDNEKDADAWHDAAGAYGVSPVMEQELTGASNTVGRRFRYRLTLSTDNATISPRVTALVLDSVTRLPTKFSYTAMFLVDDYMMDLNGKRSTATAATLEAQLSTWASSDQTAAPLTLRSVQGLFDDKLVFIEPASVRPFWTVSTGSKKLAHMIGQITLIGV